MNISAIEDAIYSWISQVVDPDDITIVWDEPDAPRPDPPSIRIFFFQASTMIGSDEIRKSLTNLDGFRIVGPREMVLSVTAYGPESAQIISDLQTSLSDPDKDAILMAAGVSILSASAPRNIPVKLETTFEKRAQVDFNILVMEEKEIAVGAVASVSIEATIIAPDGDPVIEDEEMEITADSGG